MTFAVGKKNPTKKATPTKKKPSGRQLSAPEDVPPLPVENLTPQDLLSNKKVAFFSVNKLDDMGKGAVRGSQMSSPRLRLPTVNRLTAENPERGFDTTKSQEHVSCSMECPMLALVAVLVMVMMILSHKRFFCRKGNGGTVASKEELLLPDDEPGEQL